MITKFISSVALLLNLLFPQGAIFLGQNGLRGSSVTWTDVQETTTDINTGSSGTTASPVFSGSVGVGHIVCLLYGLFNSGGNDATSGSDPSGLNTWARMAGTSQSSLNFIGSYCTVVQTSGTFTTPSLHLSSGSVASVHGIEFSGNAATSYLDSSAGATNTGTAVTSSSVTSGSPAQSQELFIGLNARTIVGGAQTATTGTSCGFGTGSGIGPVGCEWIPGTGSTPQALTWSWTGSDTFINWVAAVKHP